MTDLLEKSKLLRSLTELDSLTQDRAAFVGHWNRLLEVAKYSHNNSSLQKEKMEKEACFDKLPVCHVCHAMYVIFVNALLRSFEFAIAFDAFILVGLHSSDQWFIMYYF